MTVTWTNVQVTLGELKPWADNPRLSSKRQAQRILDSWRQFGQVKTVAIGPSNEVYDGHQRLSALLTVHGPSYQIDARRSDRELTDEERRALAIALHAGAVGSLPIRVGKQFSSGRKLGKTHQNVLVFVKGDSRRATTACGPVEIADLDALQVAG